MYPYQAESIKKGEDGGFYVGTHNVAGQNVAEEVVLPCFVFRIYFISIFMEV